MCQRYVGACDTGSDDPSRARILLHVCEYLDYLQNKLSRVNTFSDTANRRDMATCNAGTHVCTDSVWVHRIACDESMQVNVSLLEQSTACCLPKNVCKIWPVCGGSLIPQVTQMYLTNRKYVGG